MSEINPIKTEILEAVQNYRSRKAVIYYETESSTKEISYGDLLQVSLTIQHGLEDYVRSCPVGLLMDHHPFVPSLILCLQNLNCCFVFLQNIDDIKDMAENSENIKILVSHNKMLSITNYTFKTVINLLWEHKLYIYESNVQQFNTNLNINYIVQTSGTTGNKKVVKVEHYCIYSNIRCLRSKLAIIPQDVIYFGTILCFDPSMVELYLALTTGACLLIVPKEIKENLAKLYRLLFKNPNQDHCVSLLQMCPSVFMRWNMKEIDFILKKSALRLLLLGGEAFPKAIENLREIKTRVFNIYGITEVSCWASIEEFCGREVSLGETLDDTMFEIRNADGNPIFKGEGELYIGSSKRICYINNEEINNDTMLTLFRKTGDLVFVQDNEKIFYKGRTDDIFKRFGIQINSSYVENQIFKITQLENILVFIDSICKLVLFIKVNEVNRSVIVRICDKLRVKLLHTLEKEHFPDQIETVKAFPINENGKIDRKKLKILAEETFEKQMNDRRQQVKIVDGVEIFKHLWLKYLNVPQKLNDFLHKTFYDLGGTSILRLQFSNEYEELVQNNELPINFYDYLFTSPYNEVINFIKNYKFKRKRTNIASDNKKLKSVDNRIEMNIKWSYDLQGCVDTTPCIIKNKEFVAAGAFSNILAVLNICNGTEVSKTIFPNAMESSCLSTELGDIIYVGCYDGSLYCIKSSTGQTIWSYKTNDKVKNKPCFVDGEEVVVFGSYDKYLYCLEAMTGSLIWKNFLNSAITADTLYLKEVESIFVVTINGTCFVIKRNGETLWNKNLESPVFSSPCLFQNDACVIVAEVRGTLHCLNNKNGTTLWNYDIGNHIYSSIKTYKNLLILNSHDSFMYCLEVIDGEIKLKFKIQLESASSSNVEIVTKGNIDYLVATSINGTVYLIDLENVSILNKLKLNAEIFSSPVSYRSRDDDVLILIGCRDNKLHCIELIK